MHLLTSLKMKKIKNLEKQLIKEKEIGETLEKDKTIKLLITLKLKSLINTIYHI